MSSSKRTMTGLTLRLEIEVEYDLNGTSTRYLEELLRDNAIAMAHNGMMTGTSSAEVNDWDFRVVWVGEVMSDQEKE